MDRYVIRVPRPENATGSQKEGPNYKQTTIESLKGVVVIEEILRMKARLKLKDQASEVLLETLKELQQKIPSRDVMKSTKIGHAVNKLTKHSDKDVSYLAAEIVKSWKRHFEEKLDRPMIEVKCDRKTESLREAGRKLLAGAMKLSASNRLVENIEREAFHQHNRLVSVPYRQTMRSLVFTLKHQANVREKVMDNSLQVTDFVQQYKKVKKS